MKIAAIAASAFVLASPQVNAPPAVSEAADGPPFEAVAQSFPTAEACAEQLARLVKEGAPPAFERAVGPYVIAPGDVRAHRVRAEHWGHAIEEYRCLGARLESRRWTRSMSDVKPFTIEDIGRMSFPAEPR